MGNCVLLCDVGEYKGLLRIEFEYSDNTKMEHLMKCIVSIRVGTKYNSITMLVTHSY